MNPTSAKNPFIYNTMPEVAKWIINFLDSQPILAGLLILMVLDTLVGICRAAITKTLSSTISWRGMSRKVIMLLMVGTAAAIEPFAGGIPLSKLVGMFYTVTEALSILENAAASGVPLPAALINVLAKLREDGNQKHLPLPGSQQPSINLPPGTHLEGKLDVPVDKK